jgi:hypothetical protein
MRWKGHITRRGMINVGYMRNLVGKNWRDEPVRRSAVPLCSLQCGRFSNVSTWKLLPTVG